MGVSLTKQQLRDAIDQLPENATVEDAIERLCFLAKVDEGLGQSAAGKTLPHQEAVRRLTA
jgi:predicted transcriptional regulator